MTEHTIYAVVLITNKKCVAGLHYNHPSFTTGPGAGHRNSGSENVEISDMLWTQQE